MSFLKYIYMTKTDALEYGFTHEGHVFNIPSYLHAGDTPDDFYACPKIPVLQLVVLTLDLLFATFAEFLPPDVEVETPHEFGKPLPKPSATPEM